VYTDGRAVGTVLEGITDGCLLEGTSLGTILAGTTDGLNEIVGAFVGAFVGK
jgi:hypothetical protein